MPKQTLAITTCRVSTPEQIENHSLARQADAVVKAAKELGAIIPEDGQWSGSVSSKAGTNTARKDLQQMIAYCKKYPAVKYLIVHEVDRFMRSVDELFYFEVTFREIGVKIIYASQPELNTDDVHSKLLKALEAFKSEGSNVERQKKSIDGQTDALKQGRYPFAPKPGYIKGHVAGVQEIHPVRGPILKSTLLSIVNRRLTPTDALIKLNDSEFTADHSTYKMDKFRKIITDPFYAGIVEINKQVKVRNENGLHEPLITIEQHKQLINIMSARPKTQSGPRKGGNPEYPLSNNVSCEECKESHNCRLVGFKHGNGKQNSTLVWHKYRCRSCGRYVTREELHQKVTAIFNMWPLTEDGKQDLLSALQIIWERSESQSKQDAIRLRHSIEILDDFIEEKVKAATDPKYTSISEDILKIVEKKKAEKEKLQEQLTKLTTASESDNERFLNFALDFLKDIGNNFFNPDVSVENRLRCKQVIFPSGFWIDRNKKVYTPEISYLYRLATVKKYSKTSSNPLLVRVRGL